MSDFKLKVRFIDKTEGIYDCKKIIFDTNAGLFAQLRNVEQFKEVDTHLGAVTWSCGLDLAPDAMYKDITRK